MLYLTAGVHCRLVRIYKIGDIVLIKSANVEVTNVCNASCDLCSRTQLKNVMKIPKQHLNLETFKQLDWENTEMNYFVLCGGFGDPILHPKLFELIDIIHNLNIKIILHTNGEPFYSRWWTRLAETLNDVDRVTFGLDGLTKDTHEKYRGTNFDRVIRNIRTFTGAGGNAGINYIVFKHNEHEIPEVEDFAEKLGLKYTQIRRSRTYNDKLQAPSEKTKKEHKIWTKPCFMDIGEVSIDLDGKIHLCCQAYVRWFIKEMLKNGQPLKRYDTFKQLQNSIYLKYIKEMDLCNPCGQHELIV